MTETKEIRKAIHGFNGKNIIVIGDIMLDKSIYGDIERISPEAPIPIVSIQKETNIPGGAANAANNIAALGATVSVFGLVGDDEARDHIINYLEARGMSTEGIIIDYDRPTIQKTRVFCSRHHVIRYDYEKKEMISDTLVREFLSIFEKKLEHCDGVLLSDYDKGMNHKDLFQGIIQKCKQKGIPIIVDPKTDDLELYRGATVIKPNHKEAQHMTKIEKTDDQNIQQAGEYLVHHLDANIIITQGEKGMYLFEKELEGKGKTHIPTHARALADVTGAGDTVASLLTLSLASGLSLNDAAMLATVAAGIVVAEPGTTIITTEKLEGAL